MWFGSGVSFGWSLAKFCSCSSRVREIGKFLVLFKQGQVAVVAEYLFLGGMIVTVKTCPSETFTLGVAESLSLGGMVLSP